MFQGLAQFAQRSAWHGAMTFILLWLGGLSIFSFLGLVLIHLFMGIPVLTDPDLIDQLLSGENMAAARLLQIVSSFGSFLVPGWIFTKVIDRPFSSKRINYGLLSLSLLVPLVALPIVDWLATLNEMLSFPVTSIDEWMRMKETQAGEIYEVFLDMNGAGDLAINLLMMAFIPAVGEELLFRAGLQQYLGKYIKNQHVAIWCAAILFSAIHFQFYTFIPRLVMGAGLGYLFYWGGNIGYAIVAHFVNNAAAVIMAYLSGNFLSEDAFDQVGSSLTIWVAVSMIILGGMFFGFRRLSK